MKLYDANKSAIAFFLLAWALLSLPVSPLAAQSVVVYSSRIERLIKPMFSVFTLIVPTQHGLSPCSLPSFSYLTLRHGPPPCPGG